MEATRDPTAGDDDEEVDRDSFPMAFGSSSSWGKRGADDHKPRRQKKKKRKRGGGSEQPASGGGGAGSATADVCVGYDALWRKRVALPTAGLELPAADELFPAAAAAAAADPEMQRLKRHANETRGQLSVKDVAVWRQHTSRMLQTAEVARHANRAVDPELGTKAFYKMYELLH